MISIVIPAYNESAVIKRALYEITKGAHTGELDVIVVCNGCTDDTAQLARQVGSSVRVIETITGNKPYALNLADAAAGSTFPRVYMDADVLMDIESLRALASRLTRSDVLVAAPTARIVVDRCTLFARWYYEIAALLPSTQRGLGVSGVYALSHEGRRRFDRFPNLNAEDEYVWLNFKSHERETVASATATVFKPAKLRNILRVNIRWKRSHRQLARAFPDLWASRQGNHKTILTLFKRLKLWPKLVVYCAVVVTAQAAVYWPAGKKYYQWLRDESTR